MQFYARNDHMGLAIPYEYMGIDHAYEPDFLVRLSNGVTVVLEIKGFEDDQTKAKHTAANRWVEAVNHWGQLGAWVFYVCRNPQLLDKEMKYLAQASGNCLASRHAAPAQAFLRRLQPREHCRQADYQSDCQSAAG